MTFSTSQTLRLSDVHQHYLGQITITENDDGLFTGQFTAGADFVLVQDLFAQFEEAVDAQALTIVDELDKAIAQLGLHLWSPDMTRSIPIYDVQIWSDGYMTCRPVTEPVRSLNGQQKTLTPALK